ncbi:alpha/beta hydrolase [Azospirillum picis]|uniref:Acyl-CoA:diacylglycerol acyltransferase n=1 Tax=Azospirillum picis TaxID=488438 RepID=A0ABU0MML2_9PROT|nr:alpha/beta hydrolase-fold protein [Azospirillum picis]MBP2300748.1 putative alpha/beta superfamily hydrolase [Azospirillum picis]MDQ0534717.1 putative alpha/beta superfamily hydrolase [Azospirillum picis]
MMTRRALLGVPLAAAVADLSLTGPAAAAETAGVTLPRTVQWQMTAGGDPARPYSVFAAWPETPPPPDGYPVLYLLDGNSVFGTATEAMRVVGGHGAAVGIAPAVVVAVGYPTERAFEQTRRARDYTPPAEGAPPGTGGADAFLAFLEDQVKPEVERRFRIDRSRQTLFGHSFGGLFVLYALFSRCGAFQRYVAASPSVWWQDRAVLSFERRFTEALPPEAATRSLLVTVGENELSAPPGEPADPARDERRRKARMVENARDLAERLRALAPRGPAVTFVSFPGETHGSVIPAAVSRAVAVAIRR